MAFVCLWCGSCVTLGSFKDKLWGRAKNCDVLASRRNGELGRLQVASLAEQKSSSLQKRRKTEIIIIIILSLMCNYSFYLY